MTKVDYQNLVVRNEYDTIHTILGRNASIGRFGDGELRICLGGRTKPQPYSDALKARLLQILSSNDFDFLVGIPRVLGRQDDYPAKKHWERFFSNEKHLGLLDPNKQYFSSFISRKESAPGIENNRYWDLVAMLWLGRDIVIVQGNKGQITDACIVTNEFMSCCSINNIMGPSEDAFRYHDEILGKICAYPKDYLILLSLGAAATVLAYDLHEKGYQALDIGRLPIHHAEVMRQYEEI